MKTARLSEHSSRHFDWQKDVREAIARSALDWKTAHGLNAPPLSWGGADGKTLTAAQWVGVCEVEGHRVEIYPKLDKNLVENADVDDDLANSTLAALLPMLEAAQWGDVIPTDRAALGHAPLAFVDVWALLLGRHLRAQLQLGLERNYVAHQDDLSAIRGRVLVARQVAHNFNRFDRIACGWDEFTADTALNRLFKCACALLQKRTRHPVARGLLGDCLFVLEEVADVAPANALRATERLTWTRQTQRFEPCGTLARRILRELAPAMNARSERSWTFLVNMNHVFEEFCAAALRARFGAVETQKNIGTLLGKQIIQRPDFCWSFGNENWIGDAKWKLLEQNGALKWDAGIVRQLTVYGELARRHQNLEAAPQLAILYPLLDESGKAESFATWNDSALHLWPVRVRDWTSLSAAILVE